MHRGVTDPALMVASALSNRHPVEGPVMTDTGAGEMYALLLSPRVEHRVTGDTFCTVSLKDTFVTPPPGTTMPDSDALHTLP